MLVAAFDRGRVDVDQIIDRHAAIHEGFHFVFAELFDILTNARAMIRHLVHHLATGVREISVILEKIAMTVNVCHHQFLIDGVVAAHQIGVTRVIIDDHLIYFRQTVIISFAQFFVLHPERPVRVARREAAIGGDFVEVIGVDDFENGFVKIQSVFAHIPFDFLFEDAQMRRQIRVVKALHGGSLAKPQAAQVNGRCRETP